MIAQRVCMIVWNEFLHDARVTKEAETLSRAGYLVTVFALDLSGKVCRRENHPGGFHVIRVPFFLQGVWRLVSAVALYIKGWWSRISSKTMVTDEFKWSNPADGYKNPSFFEMLAVQLIKGVTHAHLMYKAVCLRADIYHAHDLDVLLTTWMAARLRRARVVYDAHEITTYREGYEKSRPFFKILERVLIKKVDAIITTNHVRAVFFQKEYGIDPPQILQNRPRFQVVSRTQKLRESLNLRKELPIVLYQGGIQRGRGMRNIIEVAERVEDAYFVFMGAGKLEQDIRDMIAEKGLGNMVFIHPMVSLQELPAYTACGDIGIQILRNTCLNHYTSESNKLFEYLMAGLPVIASDFPVIRGIVQKYDVGLLVNPDDVDQISRSVKRLITEKSLYDRFRRNALAAASELSWEAQEGQLVKLYQGIC